MLRRPTFYSPISRIGRICTLKTSFNEILNEAVVRADQSIMNVTTLVLQEHFDEHGNLSHKGKREFWLEVDHLLEHFDAKKIMLLPAKNQKATQHQHKHNSFHFHGNSSKHNNNQFYRDQVQY